MTKNMLQVIIALLFVILTGGYYALSFGIEVDRIFLTISTFLFSIFTGFFIARQGKRYSSIRKEVASFDGNMSFMYRVSGHLGEGVQQKIGSIITRHYMKILEKRAWDYHFTHKSSTLTDIHTELDATFKEKELLNLKNNALNRIIAGLLNAQIARKQMVALYQERIPRFQWLLMYLFVVILLATVSTIPSVGFLLGSALKAAFVISILSVMIILHKLDNLSFFEGTIGENDAHDVIDIVKGVK